jgi:hypothetical protein
MVLRLLTFALAAGIVHQEQQEIPGRDDMVRTASRLRALSVQYRGGVAERLDAVDYERHPLPGQTWRLISVEFADFSASFFPDGRLFGALHLSSRDMPQNTSLKTS